MSTQQECLIRNDQIVLPASPQHAEEIVHLLWQAWCYAYLNTTYDITEDDLREKFGSVDKKIVRVMSFLDSLPQNPQVTYLVAQTKGGVSGLFYGTRTQEELYINALYVHPSVHRSGIGSLLLHKAILTNPGIEFASADVIIYNKQALDFYRKHKFTFQKMSQTPFGRFPRGNIIPEVRMIKDLQET